MDLALPSNSRLFRSTQRFFGQIQQYTSSLVKKESQDASIEDPLTLGPNIPDTKTDISGRFKNFKSQWHNFKEKAWEKGVKYAAKKMDEANEKFAVLRDREAMQCLNTTKNPFRDCMFPAASYFIDGLPPSGPSPLLSYDSGSSGSSEVYYVPAKPVSPIYDRFYVAPEPAKLNSLEFGDCEFSERIEELEISRDAFIEGLEEILSSDCVHPVLKELCDLWKTNKGLNEEDGELLLYLVLGRKYEWDSSVTMDVAEAMKSHMKVQEAIKARIEAVGISYESYDKIEDEIWDFVESHMAPRKAVDLACDLKSVLAKESVSLQALCDIFGPLKLVVQVGPHESILAFHEKRAFVQDFYPLNNKEDYPTTGRELGNSHWGPILDLDDFNGGVIVKVIKRSKYMRRVKGLDNWNDDPASEVATHRYLSSFGHPNIVRFVAVTMDNLNVYYYQERGVELFSTVKKHREKFWDQWKATLATKPNGYHLQHKSLWEQRMTEIFRGVFEAVAFMHSKNIIHRDLKLENLVAVGSEGNLTGKLIDFGVTLRHGEWEGDMQNHGKVGTYPFMSPEMSYNHRRERAIKAEVTIDDFESYNGALNDVWTLAHALWGYSMGVLLWSDISTTDARFTIATRARFCANPSPWKFRSLGLRYLATRYGPNRTNMCTENLIDLMEKILCPEKNRLTAEQCLEHPWFKES